MSDRKIIERLQKIKALAERGAEGEAENAAKLLGKMLAKHRLSIADIEIKEEPEDVIEKIRHQGVSNTSWQRTLASACARYFDCRYAYTTGVPTDMLCGYTEDIECFKYLFTVAKRQIETQTKEASRKGEIKGRRAMNAYRLSMVMGFRTKLDEMKRDICQEDQAYGLMVMDRSSKVNAFVDKNCNIRSGRGVGFSMNGSAYDKGKSMTINTGINGRGQKRLG
jgi:hypothetical protein